MGWFNNKKKNRDKDSEIYRDEFANFYEQDLELVRKFADAEDFFSNNYEALKTDFTPTPRPSVRSAREEILLWDKNLDIKSEINSLKVMDVREDGLYLKKFQELIRRMVRDHTVFELEGDVETTEVLDALSDILEIFSSVNFDLMAGLISDSYCTISNKKGLLKIDFYHILNSEREEDLRVLLKQYLSKKVAFKKSCISVDVPNIKAAQGCFKIQFQVSCEIEHAHERKARIAQLRGQQGI